MCGFAGRKSREASGPGGKPAGFCSLERWQAGAATEWQQAAGKAVGTAGDAGFSAVVDESMGEHDPFVLREELHQFSFDDLGVVGFHESEEVGESGDVGVDNDSGGDTEPCSEYNAGGFSADSGELDEFIERFGDVSAVAFNECPGHAADVVGFRAKEAERFDDGFDFGLAGESESVGIGKASEEFRGGLVDAFVGALSGEDGGGEELEGGVMVECAIGGGEESGEFADDFCGARFSCGEGFTAAAFGGE